MVALCCFHSWWKHLTQSFKTLKHAGYSFVVLPLQSSNLLWFYKPACPMANQELLVRDDHVRMGYLGCKRLIVEPSRYSYFICPVVYLTDWVATYCSKM